MTSLFKAALVVSVNALTIAMAQAQTGPAAQPATGQPGDAPDDRSVQDIIVTAQRRSESLQRVPITVTAITAQQAAASGISTTQDLSIVTPGLNFQATVGNANPYLRGVGTSFTGAGNEPPVATYVDGVYLPTMPGALLSLNSVERLEVLKGPQGTLFGRNATGGLIQVITRTPSETASVDASVGYGNFDTVNAQFYGTAGLARGLAADVAAYYNDQATGWGRNLANGEQANKQRDLAVRSKMIYRFGDNSDITLAGDYSHTKGSIGVGIRTLSGTLPITGIPFTGNFWDIASDRQPLLDTTSGGGSIQVHLGLGGVRLVSITSYREVASLQDFDQDATPAFATNVTLNLHENDFTQELQLLSDTSGPLQWIVGGFYFHENARYSPIHVTGTVFGPISFIDTYDEQKTDSVAGFGQVTYTFAPDSHLTGGLRYTYDWRTLTGYQRNDFGIALSPAARQISKGQPSWRLSVDHLIDNRTLLFASYNRGFKSGTFNLAGGGLTKAPLRTEQLDAFETGVKSRIGALQFGVSAFYYAYSNIQLFRTDFGVQTAISADATIYGVDADATLRLFPGMFVRAGGEVLHGRYKNFLTAVRTVPLPTGGNSQSVFDGSGQTLVNAPPVTFNIGADYTADVGMGTLGFNVTYYYNDGWYPEADNRIRQPSYNLLNAQVSLKPAGLPLEIKFWGKNLTNARYFQSIRETTLSDNGSVGAPRTYGITTSVHF